ncbi:MAG TPA: YdjY domain-containing protein [Isosphaeraceae bacterium]|jgi:hypothetical protein|nr:YdjY domain-containing protein [Isosphaeraceae bacterium]
MLAPLLLTAAVVASQAQAPARRADDPPPDSFQPDPSWKDLNKGRNNLWFDPKGRRLILRARVAQHNEVALEHLLCLARTKEHESVLATDAPARMIQAGLLLTGAEPIHPVRFRPRFEPPEGTPIAVEAEWVEDGKARRLDAREFVKDIRSGKTLDRDWVFGGSLELIDPDTKRPLFAADDGDLITVANFPSAILDVPFASSDSDAERTFVANSAKVPPKGTYVTLILRPTPAKEKTP